MRNLHTFDYIPVTVADAVAELCERTGRCDRVVIDLLQMGFISAVRKRTTGELSYLPTASGLKIIQDIHDT